jgi:hypothetical protein
MGAYAKASAPAHGRSHLLLTITTHILTKKLMLKASIIPLLSTFTPTMIRVLLFAIFAYFLYRFVFDFIIPIYKTTKHVKKGFKDMNKKMNEQRDQQNGFQQNPSSNGSTKKQPAGDYIDFEEIK